MNEKIHNPRDSVALLKSISKKRQEHFGIICLDGGMNVISKKVLFIGGESKALIDEKIIFWEACTKKATAIILFHNHPSGTDEPSFFDIDTTKKIEKACEVLGLHCLDHIIITKHSYFSFLEHNLMTKTESVETKVAE